MNEPALSQISADTNLVRIPSVSEILDVVDAEVELGAFDDDLFGPGAVMTATVCRVYPYTL